MTGRIALMVSKGMLLPADAAATAALKARGYHVGDVLMADLKKERNPKFHRLVHQIGAMVAANIDDFHGLDAHAAIKRIQLDGGIECEERIVDLPGIGKAKVSTPRSIAFEKMDETQFHALAQALCRYVAERYWPTLDAEKVQAMAESFIE